MEENITMRRANITLANNFTIHNVNCYATGFCIHCECALSPEVVEHLFNMGIDFCASEAVEFKPGNVGSGLKFSLHVTEVKHINFQRG